MSNVTPLAPRSNVIDLDAYRQARTLNDKRAAGREQHADYVEAHRAAQARDDTGVKRAMARVQARLSRAHAHAREQFRYDDGPEAA